MASSSSSSTHTISTLTQLNNDKHNRERRAGPLPTKVGELGYDGDLTVAPMDPTVSTETLVGPHPAERERDGEHQQADHHHHRHQHIPSSSSSILPPIPSSSTTTLPLTQTPADSSVSLSSRNTSLTIFKRRLKNFSPSPKSKAYLLGATPRTVVRFFVQLGILSATVTGWIFAVRHLQASPPINPNNPDNSSSLPASGAIFIHVAFTVAVLIQLLFLERCIFHLRAERWMFRNPTAVLPLHATTRAMHSRMAYAPWNRPPLPTYAAALGFRGTGDVEDSEIARVYAIGSGDVPPQYGNTRGSTLLAYGLGGRVVRSSVGSQMSQISEGERRADATSRSQSSTPQERPVSYGQSEQLEDAFRAQRLEEALLRLEAGSTARS